VKRVGGRPLSNIRFSRFLLKSPAERDPENGKAAESPAVRDPALFVLLLLWRENFVEISA
jgi:hypothetical protein